MALQAAVVSAVVWAVVWAVGLPEMQVRVSEEAKPLSGILGVGPV